MNKYLLGIILTLVTAFGITLYVLNNKNNELNISKHNIEVMRDSVRTLTLKNGERVSTIDSYILKKNELEKYLNISNEEIKELEKKLGNKVAYVSNISSSIKYDSIVIKDTVTTHNDTISFNILYNDDWLHIHGLSYIKDNIATTTLDSITVPTPLQVGLTDDYRIWVKSKNPYLNISNIEGAVIEGSRLNQKQKRLSIGLNGGFGLQYGLTHKNIDLGPYIGLGVNYKLF